MDGKGSPWKGRVPHGRKGLQCARKGPRLGRPQRVKDPPGVATVVFFFFILSMSTPPSTPHVQVRQLILISSTSTWGVEGGGFFALRVDHVFFWCLCHGYIKASTHTGSKQQQQNPASHPHRQRPTKPTPAHESKFGLGLTSSGPFCQHSLAPHAKTYTARARQNDKNKNKTTS